MGHEQEEGQWVWDEGQMHVWDEKSEHEGGLEVSMRWGLGK